MAIYADNLGGGGAPPLPAATYATSGTAVHTQSSASSRTRQASRARRAQIQQAPRVADASGTALSTNDSSGFGLKRPYIPWNVYPTAQETAPSASTTSGTFGALLTVATEPQHPRVRVRIVGVTGAGTTGEVRLVDRVSGTVIAGPTSLPAAAATEATLEGALIGPTLSGAGAPMRVDVEARRVGGANTVAVHVIYVVGVGT